MNTEKMMVAAVAAGMCLFAQAELKLRHIYTDHMVLQQEAPIVVAGYADPGSRVELGIGDRKGAAVADKDGKWRGELAALKAGGPYELSVSDGKRKIALKDVMVGELWIASGQSNMEMPVWSGDQYYRLPDGQKVAGGANDPLLRFLPIPLAAVQDGPKEEIALWKGWPGWQLGNSSNAVLGTSATGYMFGKYLRKRLNCAVGVVNSHWGGMPIERFLKKGDIFNAMVAPLETMRPRGVIWYQGCSNTGRWKLYADQQARLVVEWRELFKCPEMGFICTQLAGFEDHRPKKPFTDAEIDALPPRENGYVFIRPEQEKIRSVKNCECVSAIDIGMHSDIHPKNKDEVGRRLAAAAAKLFYGAKDAVRGPQLVKAVKKGNVFELKFDVRVIVKGGKIGPREFTVAGADGKRVWATAEQTAADTVAVRAEGVSDPARVDYLWAPYSPSCSLYNAEGFPVTPFYFVR